MYSIAKIHYTTITMNKEGIARFMKKKRKKKSYIYIKIHYLSVLNVKASPYL